MLSHKVRECQNLGLKPLLNSKSLVLLGHHHVFYFIRQKNLPFFLTCIQVHSCSGARSKGHPSVHTEIYTKYLPMCPVPY